MSATNKNTDKQRPINNTSKMHKKVSFVGQGKYTFRLFDDAITAGYKFKLHTETETFIFSSKDVSLLDNEIEFSGRDYLIRIKYKQIETVRPLLNSKTIELAVAAPIKSKFFTIPIILLLLGLILSLNAKNLASSQFIKTFIPLSVNKLDTANLINEAMGTELTSFDQSTINAYNGITYAIISHYLIGVGFSFIIASALVFILILQIYLGSNILNRAYIFPKSGNGLARKFPSNNISSTNAEKTKSWLGLYIELAKVTAWPIIVIFILISFWAPLQSTISQLPNIVSQSDVITIAGLSLQINRNLELKGKSPTPAVKEALVKLNSQDISTLLNLRESACYHDNIISDDLKNKYKSLIDLGLFEERPPESFESDSKCTYVVAVTDFGKETQNYLYALIAEFANQLESSALTPTP